MISTRNEAPLLGLVTTDKNTLPGVKAAPGMAIGHLVHQTNETPEFSEQGAESSQELKDLDTAIKKRKSGPDEADRYYDC